MGVRLLVDPALGSIQPLTTFYLAVGITAWFSGFWPAIVVTLVGYVVADWFFIAPRYELGFLSPRIHVLVGAPIYFLVGAVIAGVTESLRRAERRADEKARELAEKARELAEKVRESAERAAELQALFDAAPIGIWVAHDAACQRITGNRFADELLDVPNGGNVSAGPTRRPAPRPEGGTRAKP
jgi:K+-sensing histidine kinase KdpD